MNNTKRYNILRVRGDKISKDEDIVIKEYKLTIFVNGDEMTSLLCIPDSLENLVIGYLYSENYIRSISQIKSMEIDEGIGRAYIDLHDECDNIEKENIFSQNSKTQKIRNQKQIEIQEKTKFKINAIRELVNQFNKNSKLFTNTGGVHSCALCSLDDIMIFKEDIGRHNAVDKVLGQALKEKIDTRNKIILTSGRISTEILTKVSRREIAIIVSISAVTDEAIEMAKELNITLIGFARGEKMNIYSGFPSLKI